MSDQEREEIREKKRRHDLLAVLGSIYERAGWEMFANVVSCSRMINILGCSERMQVFVTGGWRMAREVLDPECKIDPWRMASMWAVDRYLLRMEMVQLRQSAEVVLRKRGARSLPGPVPEMEVSLCGGGEGDLAEVVAGEMRAAQEWLESLSEMLCRAVVEASPPHTMLYVPMKKELADAVMGGKRT